MVPMAMRGREVGFWKGEVWVRVLEGGRLGLGFCKGEAWARILERGRHGDVYIAGRVLAVRILIFTLVSGLFPLGIPPPPVFPPDISPLGHYPPRTFPTPSHFPPRTFPPPPLSSPLNLSGVCNIKSVRGLQQGPLTDLMA